MMKRKWTASWKTGELNHTIHKDSEENNCDFILFISEMVCRTNYKHVSMFQCSSSRYYLYFSEELFAKVF